MNNPDLGENNHSPPITAFDPGNIDERDRKAESFLTHDAVSAKPRNSILYSNAEDTIFVVDILKSIVRAQSLPQQLVLDLQLSSCPALVAPYPSTEPRSEKARNKLLDRLAHSAEHIELHDEYSRLITDALERLKEHYVVELNRPLSFCLPRAVKVEGKTENNIGKPSKRKAESESIPYYDANPVSPSLTLLENHSKSSSKDTQTGTTLPPLTSVLLGPIDTSISTLSTFHTACLAHPRATNGRFPLVVLDPPWPNKSVSRSSSYATSPTLVDLTETLQGLGLEEHIADKGFVACWVTNNPTIRDAVIGEGGLFEAWDVELVEEWIWCKVTIKGEPVTDVNGIWRKPYEACLIGKRTGNIDKQRTVKRRIVLGVPDLHSRKPCLKGLAARLLLEDKDQKESSCAALELFARYAVAGWMSWGLEATKYNHADWWTKEAAVSGTN